jgi:hypothetical protein
LDTEGLGTDRLEFIQFSAGRPDNGFSENTDNYWEDDGTCSGANAII